MLEVPHPVLMQLACHTESPPSRPECTCDWASRLRIKYRERIDLEACGGERPAEIRDAEGGEKWDQAKYTKMLRDMIEWTYEICERSRRAEGAYMAVHYPRSCKDDRFC